jgi:arylsulfatase A-like enzyme
VLAKSLQVAPEGGFGLTLLHLPVPHPPYFYNAATGKNDFGATPFFGILKQNQQGYIDALELTDKTICAIRREMEKAGTWDTTTLIFSSDHPYRHHDTLDGKARSNTVPYLIKMAGQSSGLQYDTPFSALLTGKLILACLSGELSRPEQVAGWLDAHRSEYPIQ